MATSENFSKPSATLYGISATNSEKLWKACGLDPLNLRSVLSVMARRNARSGSKDVSLREYQLLLNRLSARALEQCSTSSEDNLGFKFYPGNGRRVMSLTESKFFKEWKEIVLRDLDKRSFQSMILGNFEEDSSMANSERLRMPTWFSKAHLQVPEREPGDSSGVAALKREIKKCDGTLERLAFERRENNDRIRELQEEIAEIGGHMEKILAEKEALEVSLTILAHPGPRYL